MYFVRYAAEQRRNSLMDAADFHRFFNMVRELRLWMEDIRHTMSSHDLPRDVSGVELMMNLHQGIRAEIDAREENFSVCINLGRMLLHRRNATSVAGLNQVEMVREKLIVLIVERVKLNDQWNDRCEELRLSKNFCYYIDFQFC